MVFREKEYSREKIIEMVKNDPTQAMIELELDDYWIYDLRDEFGKNIVINFDLSDKLFRDLFNIGFLDLNDIKDLTLKTYFNLDSKTIEFFSDNLNWNKYIILLANSDNFDIMSLVYKIKNNKDVELWKVISSLKLPLDFLKLYRKRIDWVIYTSTNNVTDDILEEFDDILEYDEVYKCVVYNKLENRKTVIKDLTIEPSDLLSPSADDISDMIYEMENADLNCFTEIEEIVPSAHIKELNNLIKDQLLVKKEVKAEDDISESFKECYGNSNVQEVRDFLKSKVDDIIVKYTEESNSVDVVKISLFQKILKENLNNTEIEFLKKNL